MERNKYRLIKDYVLFSQTIKAGTIYQQYKTGRSYFSLMHLKNGKPHSISASTIKSNPDWFELIPESKELLQVPVEGKLIITSILAQEVEKGEEVYKITCNKSFPPNSGEKIKEAIESICNPSTTYTEQGIKPPLGILSEWLWKEQRLEELNAAIKRYSDRGMEISPNCSSEKHYLEQEIKGLKHWYTQKEVDEISLNAFNAGRDRIGGWWNEQIKNWAYKTHEDYKQFASKYLPRIPEKQPQPTPTTDKQDGWEITQFITKNEPYRYHSETHVNSINKFGAKERWENDIPLYLSNENWEIHSVKRLCDSQVFTVGDKIWYDYKLTSPTYPFPANPCTIEGFKIVDGEMNINIGKQFECIKSNEQIFNIRNASKTQPSPYTGTPVPLFKTEDGK